MKWGLGQTSDTEQEAEHRKHLPQLESTGSGGRPDACFTASLHRDPATPETEAQRGTGAGARPHGKFLSTCLGV